MTAEIGKGRFDVDIPIQRSDEIGDLAVSVKRMASERKLAEDGLRESEERLVLSLKSGRIGTYYWNIRDDTHFWDDRMHEIWGLEPGTYQGSMAAVNAGVKVHHWPA